MPTAKRLRLWLLLAMLCSVGVAGPAPDSKDPFVGRWALTLSDGSLGWLGITQDENGYSGSIVWGIGKRFEFSSVTRHGEEMVLRRQRHLPVSQAALDFTQVLTVRLDGDTLILSSVASETRPGRAVPTEAVGHRIAPLPPAPDLSLIVFGRSIPIFNGRDLDGWQPLEPDRVNGWNVNEGVLSSRSLAKSEGPKQRYANLRTTREFSDFRLSLDFRLPVRSNSGIYLRGLYEVQLANASGPGSEAHGLGAVYGRVAPTVPVPVRPGDEWQSIQVTLVRRHVTVVLNGVKIIENQPLLGVTGGALSNDELSPGPIYLQGDHGQVSFRNINLEPVIGRAAEEYPLSSEAWSEVPGVVIDHLPAANGAYVGSPSIVILPEGTYIASHDHFGPATEKDTVAVFASEDRGLTWKRRSVIKGQFWSSIFTHRDALYLLGTRPQMISIRRSDDGGRTWSEPTDSRSGLITADGNYHCAPMPVVEHAGRIWRAMEENGMTGMGSLSPLMLSAPVDADLLDAANWTLSEPLQYQRNWLPRREFRGWMEGNVVVDDSGNIVNILRVHTYQRDEQAAIIRYSADGKSATFDPVNDIVDFPGGAKKFTIRRDPDLNRYWSLANWVPPRQRVEHPARNRNTLALISSDDLRHWTVNAVILQHPDRSYHGFQYVDWQFDGDDLVAVSRTGYDDGLTGSHSYHDANFLTFHRVEDFRRWMEHDLEPETIHGGRASPTF